MTRLIALAALVWLAAFPRTASAQDLRAMARLLPELSSIANARRGVEIDIALSQAVPFRLALHDRPERLRLSFREVDWRGADPGQIVRTDRILNAATSRDAPGWSSLVLTLDRPYEITSAEMRIDEETGGAHLAIRLRVTKHDRFARLISPAPEPGAETGQNRRQTGGRRLRVVLDPGHGGFDPGARNGGYSEAVLMLTFVRELREKLVRSGRYDVYLTRNSDQFVPLPERVAIARRNRADIFLSFHADALTAGRATGATVYSLSDEASDQASALLAERLNRDELLAGVDLGLAGDGVATALMDMARRETRPRSERLADHLVGGLFLSLGRMHKTPRLEADFAVLRAPDIPSVLVELGFVTSPGDLENLLTREWRELAAQGILSALDAWSLEDAAQASLVRQ